MCMQCKHPKRFAKKCGVEDGRMIWLCLPCRGKRSKKLAASTTFKVVGEVRFEIKMPKKGGILPAQLMEDLDEGIRLLLKGAVILIHKPTGNPVQGEIIRPSGQAKVVSEF